MIDVDLSVVIGFLLDSSILICFILYWLNNIWFIKKEKNINLQKKKCEICEIFSFVNSRDGYWRCPNCESLNRGE
ncbi:MAG: hypothetical protein K9L84_04640 [Candidatus Omnitrophica bacterium]|nr:hypothetical protein [Candidatus Omnitrophota bacterium]MCF7894330.1 hypothetical protein [Candidatus Omnitrophota bacterium]